MPYLQTEEPRWALLIRVDSVLASSEPHPSRDTGQQTLRQKANPDGQQALSEPTSRHPQMLRTRRNTHPKYQSGTHACGSVRKIGAATVWPEDPPGRETRAPFAGTGYMMTWSGTDALVGDVRGVDAEAGASGRKRTQPFLRENTVP